MKAINQEQNNQFIKTLELLKYESPTIIEFISWNWLQNIFAKLLAKKVNYKLKRYKYRLKREEYLKNLKLI